LVVDISKYNHIYIYIVLNGGLYNRVSERGFTSKQCKKVIYGREKHRNRS